MPKSNAAFFCARQYVHPEEHVTSALPEATVQARQFSFYNNKEERDNNESPIAVVSFELETLPPEALRMLAAVGLNARMGQQLESDQSIEENVSNLNEYFELLKNGTLREAGAGSAGAYVPIFLRDFRRFVEIETEQDCDIARAKAMIETAESRAEDEEEFKAWKKKIMQTASFQKAKLERLQAKVEKAPEASDLLSGLEPAEATDPVEA